MKSCLFIILFHTCSLLNCFCFSDEKGISYLSGFSISPQEAPFYFLKVVPPTIKILNKADLSFFRNQSIVTQYRYRLEIPEGGGNAIDMNLARWSPWIAFDFIELIIPTLDREGGYRLNIEYRTSKSSEILKFEKLFYVYRFNPALSVETPKTKTEPVKSTTGSRPNQVSEVPLKKTPPVTDNTSRINRPAAGKATVQPKLTSGPTGKRTTPVIGKITIKYASFNFLALNGIDLNNESIFRNQIHQPGQPSATPVLEAATNTINNNGNTQLIAAILSGENDNAISLIDQGADLNLKNELDLSPLHIAVFLNNKTIVNHLLMKGADANLRGNSGYTPLHIASELNHAILARDLLYNGAGSGMKTDQKLSAKSIARIQENSEIVKIITSKGAYTPAQPDSSSNQTGISRNIVRLSPRYEFSLPYNEDLLRKRQFNKIMTLVSIPLFSIASAGTFYLRAKANNYYSSYKNAETIDMAKHYYDKTMQLDTYTYISGGLSITSAFGMVHSAIRKKSISNKMRKALY